MDLDKVHCADYVLELLSHGGLRLENGSIFELETAFCQYALLSRGTYVPRAKHVEKLPQVADEWDDNLIVKLGWPSKSRLLESDKSVKIILFPTKNSVALAIVERGLILAVSIDVMLKVSSRQTGILSSRCQPRHYDDPQEGRRHLQRYEHWDPAIKLGAHHSLMSQTQRHP